MGLSPAESAREENMLSAARSGGNALARVEQILRTMQFKIAAYRASIMSEWTDRDMTVDNRLYLAGSVTIADILDHAAHEAKLDLKATSNTIASDSIEHCGYVYEPDDSSKGEG